MQFAAQCNPTRPWLRVSVVMISVVVLPVSGFTGVSAAFEWADAEVNGEHGSVGVGKRSQLERNRQTGWAEAQHSGPKSDGELLIRD